MYPPELSRIAGFCTNSYTIFLGEDPPDPSFKQNCLSLYYNHNIANHLKKLKTHSKISPIIFLANSRSNSLCMSYLKSPLLIIFFANGCLKEQRKVLENSLKMYFKSPWKVLKKGMSWSVGNMKARLIIFIRNKFWKSKKTEKRHKKTREGGGGQNVDSEGCQDQDRIFHGIFFLIFAYYQVQYVHVHIYYSI